VTKQYADSIAIRSDSGYFVTVRRRNKFRERYTQDQKVVRSGLIKMIKLGGGGWADEEVGDLAGYIV
jgi:hypothetical protein